MYFGIRSVERDVSRLAYRALRAQHRGQESAGIAVSGRTAHRRPRYGPRRAGLQRAAATGAGEVAIGHTRYSTTGANRWANAQPLIHHGRARTVALGHNGNLVNVEELRAGAPRRRRSPRLRLGLRGDRRPHRTRSSAPAGGGRECDARLGAYSATALVDDTLVAFRDPFGFRPLTLGQIGEDWVVASRRARST